MVDSRAKDDPVTLTLVDNVANLIERFIYAGSEVQWSKMCRWGYLPRRVCDMFKDRSPQLSLRGS